MHAAMDNACLPACLPACLRPVIHAGHTCTDGLMHTCAGAHIHARMQVMGKILAAVAHVRKVVAAAMAEHKAALLTRITSDITAGHAAVDSLRSVRQEASRSNTAAIQSVRAKQAADHRARVNQLQGLSQSVALLKRHLVVNTTGIHSSLQQMVRRVRAAQQAVVAQQDADLAEFRRDTAQDVAGLRGNMTLTLRQDLVARKQYLQDHTADLRAKVNARYAELAEDLQRDRRAEQEALTEVATRFSQSVRIAAIAQTCPAPRLGPDTLR